MTVTVSVIIPTYNRAVFLNQAIESVLNQTYKDFELIIVDDGSTDDTKKIVGNFEDPRIEYIYQQNQKLPSARNTGAKSASGKYLAFLDDDDLFSSEKLKIQTDLLELDNSIGLIAGGWQLIDIDENLIQEYIPSIEDDIDLSNVLNKGLAPIHAIMLSRDWFETVNGFDISLKACEDLDLWYRLCLAGCKMKKHLNVICKNRLHKKQMTLDIASHYCELHKVYEKIFANPGLPLDILNRKQELFGRLKVIEAGRWYAVDHFQEAQSCLNNAILINPAFKNNGYDDLFLILIDIQKTIYCKNEPKFINKVLTHLSSEVILDEDQTKSILAKSAKASFFHAYKMKNYYQILTYWVNAIMVDPLFILNRGGWSILFRSLKSILY